MPAKKRPTSIKGRAPAKSILEETFVIQLRAEKIPHAREIRFHPHRMWRFDFVIIGHKIAVETEGGTWVKGRHNTGKGYEQDCEKYSEAAILGWKVIRVTKNMILDGRAIDMTIRAIRGC